MKGGHGFVMYVCRVVILAHSWRAVELPHRLHSPRPKLQRGHLILQLDGREVEIHSRLPDDAHFFVFLVFLRPDEEAVRRFAAFLLRIKSFRSAKAAHLCSFHASGRTAAILDVAINVIRKKGCVVQNEGIT